MRVLVTGGAGFIGSHVADGLLLVDHEVAVLDNLSTGRRELVPAGVPLHVCDLRSPELGEVVARLRPEAIVHCAAQASVSVSVADPVLDASVNVLGSVALLEAARRVGTGRVVYVSTGGAAYGDTDVRPTPEDHPTRPASPYGASKVAAERYMEVWAELTGGRALTLRLANVYGPRQNPHGEAGVVAIWCDRLARGLACVINGDGAQTRDFVYVGDVAAAVVSAVQQPHAVGVVNIGTGVETTIGDLHRRLTRAAGMSRDPEHHPARPGEQRRSVLDPRRAGLVLGWHPTTSLDEGLGRTFASFALGGPA